MSANSSDSPLAACENQYPPSVQQFIHLYEDYVSILNETNQRYLDRKRQIEEVYQPRLSEIDTYLDMRGNLIHQESRFRNQIDTDQLDDI